MFLAQTTLLKGDSVVYSFLSRMKVTNQAEQQTIMDI